MYHKRRRHKHQRREQPHVAEPATIAAPYFTQNRNRIGIPR